MTIRLSYAVVFIQALVACHYSTAQTKMIELEESSGVYTIACAVNGIPLDFILDTGASDVTLSESEFNFFYRNGFIEESDIIGTQEYVYADGSIHELIVINLKEFTVGEIVLHDVKASVSEGLGAPLLLGQSVLSMLGSVTIDYDNNVLKIQEDSKSETNDAWQCGDPVVYFNVQYNTVEINGICWFSDNLRTERYRNGDLILSPTTKQWSDQIEGAYFKPICDNDFCTTIDKWGYWYNYYAVEDERNLCPSGWHVSHSYDWQKLLSEVWILIEDERIALRQSEYSNFREKMIDLIDNAKTLNGQKHLMHENAWLNFDSDIDSSVPFSRREKFLGATNSFGFDAFPAMYKMGNLITFNGGDVFWHGFQSFASWWVGFRSPSNEYDDLGTEQNYKEIRALDANALHTIKRPYILIDVSGEHTNLFAYTSFPFQLQISDAPWWKGEGEHKDRGMSIRCVADYDIYDDIRERQKLNKESKD